MDFRDSLFDGIRTVFERDERTIVLTNDMGAMGFTSLSRDYPERTCNLGIAEQNLISVAAGLSMAGFHVFAFGIASHVAYRCFEQIKLDLCASNSNVTLIGFGPGLAYGPDGPTHHATEDLATMRALPNLQIYNPADPPHVENCVQQAYEHGGPSYIRIERDAVSPLEPLAINDSYRTIHDQGDIAVFATGIMSHRAKEAITLSGVQARLFDVYRLSNLAPASFCQALQGVRHVISIEESVPIGGMGSALCEIIAKNSLPISIETVTLPHDFLHGSSPRSWAHKEFGMDVPSLIETLQRAAT